MLEPDTIGVFWVSSKTGAEMAKKDNQSELMKKALMEALSNDGANNDDLVNKVLGVLDSQRLLRYNNNNDVNLLSTPGKVLVALLENPKTSIRGISVYLCLSETIIIRAIKSLMASGVVLKTKNKQQNIYKINYLSLQNHPDIQHLSGALQIVASNIKNIEIKEDEPF